ncbi:MAG: suppressor of fused domain protein [Candidatus Obscuribacter sp.]|nr:suppressor of fused domain protein [Candidatus Obscuribacter sp.]
MKQQEGNSPDMFNISDGSPQLIELAQKHIETFIGEIDVVLHETVSDHLHVDVHVIPATEDRPFLTLITTGMSDLPMNVPEELDEYKYAELLICLPPDWPLSMEAFQDEKNYWPVRWLKTLARYPYNADTWLGMNHTIPLGDPPEPVCQGSEMIGFMLVPPMFFDEEFCELKVSDEKTVHFYQLLPLHADEMNLKVEQGADALWEKFENNVPIGDLLDPNRKSACA